MHTHFPLLVPTFHNVPSSQSKWIGEWARGNKIRQLEQSETGFKKRREIRGDMEEEQERQGGGGGPGMKPEQGDKGR